jgi:hypothetical protein
MEEKMNMNSTTLAEKANKKICLLKHAHITRPCYAINAPI